MTDKTVNYVQILTKLINDATRPESLTPKTNLPDFQRPSMPLPLIALSLDHFLALSLTLGENQFEKISQLGRLQTAKVQGK